MRIEEDCCCPRWQPTARDDDGTPCDYECPDDGCQCTIHCQDQDDGRSW